MAVSAEFDLTVQSHRGPYVARFTSEPFTALREQTAGRSHVLCDSKVFSLYEAPMKIALDAAAPILIDATEDEKSLEAMPRHVAALLQRGVRRGDVLVAVGGGIIQDIVCFLAATLLRGVEWRFFPTTLLAQADSCIGSKSSINAAGAKNILGTFTPPSSVLISTSFLLTLDERDVRSGVGEMLKVHAIAGPEAFARIAGDYDSLFAEPSVMEHYIRASLEIKRGVIELDEFDKGPRNVMNYGHTFGHAIESATDFAIPHGIAVTIGMDMANFVSARLGRAPQAIFERTHQTLKRNYSGFEAHEVPFDRFLSAIAKDKKNTATQLGVILPDAAGKIERIFVSVDDAFRGACSDYLAYARQA